MVCLLFCLFAILCGVIEAVLYARRGAEAFTRNEHIDMTLQRIVAAALAPAGALLYAWHGSVWWVAGELVPAALLFPMFHDEAYNFTRLWIRECETQSPVWGLNVPAWRIRLLSALPLPMWDRLALSRALNQYRYGYQSPTTTARNDFNGTQRTYLAVAGVVLLSTLYLYFCLCP